MTDKTFINQKELSERWKISPRTLERWRWLGTGPDYHKISGRVIYRLDGIEAWEKNRSFNCTAQQAGS